jgi:hypothetical protein
LTSIDITPFSLPGTPDYAEATATFQLAGPVAPRGRDDLKQAAESDGFAGILPQLVRRLIAESADGLTELDMPGEGGGAIGGFDGVVTADRATVEVAEGTSVWELSVDKRSGARRTATTPRASPAPRPPDYRHHLRAG